MSKKIKKEKVTYVDDGRTLADMSNVRRGMWESSRSGLRPASTARDKWNTYWNAVKMMFFPMLAFIGGLVVIYVVLYILFALAA